MKQIRSFFKNKLRSLLIFLLLDLTPNLRYDRLTKALMKRIIQKEDHCIDIGCHKGEILEDILALAPEGKHYAFEPIPSLFEALQKKYSNKVSLFSCALSDQSGESTFYLVHNAPAYSGLKTRSYATSHPEIEEIKVQMNTLDQILGVEERVDFIKLDVEGGEYAVLKGGINLLKKNQPYLLFEFGKGASDYYQTIPSSMYHLITKEIGLEIYTLSSLLKKLNPLTLEEFETYYETNQEYYFIAAPSQSR